jgi:tetratricopeptide (TPR) repeat protein
MAKGRKRKVHILLPVNLPAVPSAWQTCPINRISFIPGRDPAQKYISSLFLPICAHRYSTRSPVGRWTGQDMLENKMYGEVFRETRSSGQERSPQERAEIFRNLPQSDAQYLYELGTELSHSGKFEFAIDLLNKALILMPHFPVAWYQKGVCQDHLDNRDEALKSYDACLTHDPYHAEAWFNRGMLLKKMGMDEEGDRSVKRAVDLCCGR